MRWGERDGRRGNFIGSLVSQSLSSARKTLFVLSKEKRASPPDCARPTACSLFLRLTTRNLRSCAFVGNSITARDTAFFTRPRGRRKNKTNKKRANDVQTARCWFSQTRGGKKFLGPDDLFARKNLYLIIIAKLANCPILAKNCTR